LRQLDEMTQRWNRYKSGYERYLQPEAPVEEDESLSSADREQTEPIGADDNGDATEMSTEDTPLGDGEVESEESPPTEMSEPIGDSAPERNGEAS
jgi:hypothetical protein